MCPLRPLSPRAPRTPDPLARERWLWQQCMAVQRIQDQAAGLVLAFIFFTALLVGSAWSVGSLLVWLYYLC